MPTAEENIYGRLHAVQEYHPANASLFTDWNVQAGDVVTVASGQESYQVPVYNMKLRWTGKPKVDIEATGNPERAPLPEMKRKEYGENSSNYSSLKGFGGGLGSLTEKVAQIDGILHAAGLQIDPVSGVLLYASQRGEDFALGAEFKVQADGISALVQKTGINSLGQNETLYSKISQSAGEISTIVSKTGINSLGQDETLYSKITQTASNVSVEARQVAIDTTSAYFTGQATATRFDAYRIMAYTGFYIGNGATFTYHGRTVGEGTVTLTNGNTATVLVLGGSVDD